MNNIAPSLQADTTIIDLCSLRQQPLYDPKIVRLVVGFLAGPPLKKPKEIETKEEYNKFSLKN